MKFSTKSIAIRIVLSDCESESGNRELNLTRLLTPLASLAGSNRRAKNRTARECAALVLCRPGFEPNSDVLAHFVRCARLGGFKSGVVQTASDGVRATRRSLAVLSSAVCAGRDLNPGHELGRLRAALRRFHAIWQQQLPALATLQL